MTSASAHTEKRRGFWGKEGGDEPEVGRKEKDGGNGAGRMAMDTHAAESSFLDARRKIAHVLGHFFFFFFLNLRRMGKNKALAHHTSTYFHTRRVSI